VLVGGATGVDILDRHKNLFAPGNCTRSEDTFSDGEGAFFVNKDGPVRAIRSYMGANSGPLTQRTHIFYQRRHDITTYLRVHAIPGIVDFFDYSPAASGMIYYDDLNLSGVTIDGSPDSVITGSVRWELVNGPQGAVTHAHSISTDIPGFTYTLYYLDSTTPPETQCTGDAFAYGSSGPRIAQWIPCTDPSMACANYLNTTRYLYYDPPGMTVAAAANHYSQATNPPSFTTRAWPRGGTPTPTPCMIHFSDVHPTDYFYEPVRWLYCRGAISGYGDGTFRPYNMTTRAQLAKIVVLAEGWPIYTPPTPTFRDVPANHTFYAVIETAYNHGIISGYQCGPNCLEYLPGNNVTRAQLCKIIVLAENWKITPPKVPTFRDVPREDPFYGYIETAYAHNIISGYTCGTGCREFRPGNNATRGQICKIVYLAVAPP
jgi:S-layer homology domain